MRQAVLLFLGAVLVVNAEPQYGFSGYPIQNYFRAGFPQPSYDENQFAQQRSQSETALVPLGKQSGDPRLFFTTVTLTIATTTSTSTSTVSTTCTTSTATLKVCSPSGRRRRGMMVTGDRQVRGLFYNEKDHDHEDGSIFLPVVHKIEEPVVREERVVRETAPASVPYVIQPGFKAPEAVGSGRFLVAFGTSTVTTTTTSTYSVTLTATCSSTTGYANCASSGK